MNAFTGNCSDKVEAARSLIDRAEALVVGVGSGMTAAGGLSYADPALVEKWYPEYAQAGLKTIVDIQAAFWWFERCRPERYWVFWARHIRHVRYEAQALQPYKDLYSLVGNRDYFICTTNADGQLEKAGFPRERIFAPQGDYALFQCRTPCRDEVFDNREMICAMTGNMPNAFEIRREDIPTCPHCGGPLVPNLRCDDSFVETPHMRNMELYNDFIDARRDRRLVFLELGVGYNTPGIIRFPFERMTASLPQATLIRVNNEDADPRSVLRNTTISIREDLAAVLAAFRPTRPIL